MYSFDRAARSILEMGAKQQRVREGEACQSKSESYGAAMLAPHVADCTS